MQEAPAPTPFVVYYEGPTIHESTIKAISADPAIVSMFECMLPPDYQGEQQRPALQLVPEPDHYDGAA